MKNIRICLRNSSEQFKFNFKNSNILMFYIVLIVTNVHFKIYCTQLQHMLQQLNMQKFSSNLKTI